MEYNRHLRLRIEEDIFQKLEEISTNKDVTISELLRKIIKEFLDKNCRIKNKIIIRKNH